jgi:hypothetical protein
MPPELSLLLFVVLTMLLALVVIVIVGRAVIRRLQRNIETRFAKTDSTTRES